MSLGDDMYRTEVGVAKLISQVAVLICVSFSGVRGFVSSFAVIVLLGILAFARLLDLKWNLIT